MTPRRALVVAVAVTALVVGIGLLLAPEAHADTVADWQMNESKNARVMHDQTGGHPARIRSKVTPGGGVFRFIGRRHVTTHDGRRIIVVPESDQLDPQNATYTVQTRFRAARQFDPNIVQKGQTKQTGGFWKITLHKGKHPRCMFRDEDGTTRATGMPDLNVADGRPTTIRCTSGETVTRLTVWHRGRKRVATNDHVGQLDTINNTRPLVIGGKIDCAAQGVGCDYFRGTIDYVTIRRTP